MAFKMMHADGGNAERERECVAGCRAHQQRARKTGAAREGDCIKVAGAHARFSQHAPG